MEKKFSQFMKMDFGKSQLDQQRNKNKYNNQKSKINNQNNKIKNYKQN